ncbi:MAG: flagellar assembly protein FliW [Kiloniellaceae bacterium]
MMLDEQKARARRCAPAAMPTEVVAVETRFGIYEFTPDNMIHMPRGPHGFTEYRNFGLANLPNPAPEHFKLLQSLDDPQLSFIVTPLDAQAGIVAPDDLRDGAASVGMSMDEAVFVLIVTLRPTDKGTSATVNLRAPIVLDLERRVGRQVVLANNRYLIQQPL